MKAIKGRITKQNVNEIAMLLTGAWHVAIDTETTGLKFTDNAFMLSIAFQYNETVRGYSLDFRDPDFDECLAILLPQLTLPHCWFLMNAKFDLIRLRRIGLELVGTLWDIKTQARVIQNNLLEYSLDSLTKDLGFTKSNTVKEWITKNKAYTVVQIAGKKKREKLLHYDQVPAEIISAYAADDAIATLMKGLQQAANITLTPEIQKVAENELALLPAIFEMEWQGIKIDREYTYQAWQHESNLIREASGRFRAKYGTSIEDISKIDLVQILINEGEIINTTDKGNPSLDGDALEAMTCEAAKLIQEYRYYEKRIGSFYSSFIHFADSDGVIHPNIDPAGTETGRFSMSTPNLQQLSKDAKDGSDEFSIRKCFVPREGRIFFQWDYSQQEYRLMADYANESSLLAKIREGYDVHQATADLVGITRDEAKTVNFAILYGAGADKLASMLGISLQEARRLIDRYFYALPKVDIFIDRVKAAGRQRGYIKNWLGRRCHIAKPEWAYALPNHLIQGGGADVMKTAIVRVFKFLKDNNLQSKMVLTVHDSLVIEAMPEESWIIPKITEILESAYVSKNGITLTVDFEYSTKSLSKQDMKKGNKWGLEEPLTA